MVISTVFRYIKRTLGMTVTETVAQAGSNYVTNLFSRDTFSYDGGKYVIEPDGEYYDLVKYPDEGNREVVHTSKDKEAVQRYVDGVMADLD